MQLDARFERDDLSVQLFDPGSELPEVCQPEDCFIVTPFIKNQPLLTVRMGVHEPTQENWNDSLMTFLNNHSGWEIIDTFQGQPKRRSIFLGCSVCDETRFVTDRFFITSNIHDG
jgi:hypothetical protein